MCMTLGLDNYQQSTLPYMIHTSLTPYAIASPSIRLSLFTGMKYRLSVLTYNLIP
jgi:hypothetical protein